MIQFANSPTPYRLETPKQCDQSRASTQRSNSRTKTETSRALKVPQRKVGHRRQIVKLWSKLLRMLMVRVTELGKSLVLCSASIPLTTSSRDTTRDKSGIFLRKSFYQVEKFKHQLQALSVINIIKICRLKMRIKYRKDSKHKTLQNLKKIYRGGITWEIFRSHIGFLGNP